MHIPEEWLFGTLAALIAGIYSSLLWEVRKLRAESSDRGVKLATLTVLMKQVCSKLHIIFNDGE